MIAVAIMHGRVLGLGLPERGGGGRAGLIRVGGRPRLAAIRRQGRRALQQSQTVDITYLFGLFALPAPPGSSPSKSASSSSSEGK